MEIGIREICANPWASSFARLKKSNRPFAVFSVLLVPKGPCECDISFSSV